VTFFIQTFFIRDKVYTNFLYTGQSLFGQSLYRTKFIQGQSLYDDKVYTGTKFIQDKVPTVTKFIRGQSLYKLFSYCILKLNERLITKCEKCVIHTIKIIYSVLVLVNYHMDTFFGIGRVRAYTVHGGYPCTGGEGERWRRHYLGYTR
jgi:hypothetical protein